MVADGLALVVVLTALAFPSRPEGLTPLALVTMPVELVLGGAVLLILPATARRVISIGLGVLLGVLSVMKLLDLGFSTALARPFDPVLDLPLLDDAVRLLTATSGRAASIGVTILAVIVGIAMIVASTLAVRRLTLAALRSRSATTRLLTVATLGWLTIWLAGVQLAPGIPLAASSETRLDGHRSGRGGPRPVRPARLRARGGGGRVRGVPGDQLLTALRGKDVLITFVESYGRSALTDPRIDSTLDRSLDRDTANLSAAGFGSRSAYLTSSTAGGGSWLAHGTLLSGLWVDNQSRYRNLVASDRLTLTERLRTGRVAHRCGCSRHHEGLARGGVLWLSARLRRRRTGLSRTELQLGRDAGPVHPGEVPATRTIRKARSGDGRRCRWCPATHPGPRCRP